MPTATKEVWTCPDCAWMLGGPFPMHYYSITETWSCLMCLDLPIKNWVVKNGKLTTVNLNEHIHALNKRDGL